MKIFLNTYVRILIPYKKKLDLFLFPEIGNLQNAYFNVINENNIANGQVTNRIVVPEYTQKNKPNILKKSPTLVLNGQDPNNILPIQSTNGIKIAITPIIKPTTITEDRQNYVSIHTCFYKNSFSFWIIMVKYKKNTRRKLLIKWVISKLQA